MIGALIPRVVLPSDFGERYTLEERTLILAHEKKHLAGGDAQINAVVAGLQCLFWFNPLVHLGAAMLRIDQEIACDAAVLARHPRSRRIYGEAMLKTLLAPDAPPIGCHWPASANKQLKERFILLARHHADRRRHLAGAAVVTILSLSAGAAAWAGQPPQIIQRTLDRASRTVASPLDRLLFSSIRAGDATSVRALIARGANPDATLPGDGSSLIEAARDGHAEIVRLLLAAGVDPNRGVPDDGTPLIQASLSGRLDIVRLLVERGADVEGYVPGDETPLIRAAQVGSIEVATYLVERGADVNRAVEADPGQMRSPLGEARKNGHDIVANFLMRKGARS